MFLVIAVAGALLSVPNVALGTLPVTESFFASVTQPIGLAATPGKLLVTRPYCGNPRQVVSISPTGGVSVFATLPDRAATEDNPGACFEDYIAIAPAAADFFNTPAVSVNGQLFAPNEIGFASGFVYVMQSPQIRRITPDGSSVSTFATVPGCGPTNAGITFDRVGTFGFHLIVVCPGGRVWLFDKDGNTVAVDDSPSTPHKINTFIANLSSLTETSGPFEGPDIAPTSGFSPFGGQLLVGSENAPVAEGLTGKVFALSSSGTASTVVPVRDAEGVAFIPPTLCSFGSSGGTYFSTVFGNDSISKLPKSALAGLSGALVHSEGGVVGESEGITLLTSNGTTVTKSTFSTFVANHEGGAFCIDSVPTSLTGKIRREPDPINPKAGGVITVFFFPIPGVFDPFTMIADVDHMRAGIRGIEKSFAFCTPQPVQVPGGPARDCKFFKDKLGIPGPGVYRGLLDFRVQYAGPEGGSDGCGGG